MNTKIVKSRSGRTLKLRVEEPREQDRKHEPEQEPRLTAREQRPELLPGTINAIMHDIVDDAQNLVDMYHDEVNQETLHEEIYYLQHHTETRAYPDECLTVIDPAKWFEPVITDDTQTRVTIEHNGTHTITADTTRATLERIAEAITDESDQDGRPLLLDSPVADWLERMRDQLETTDDAEVA